MNISLSETDAEKLELELGSGTDSRITIVLQSLRSVFGTVQTVKGAGTRLKGFRSTAAELQAGQWVFGSTSVGLGRPAVLNRLNLDLHIPAQSEGGVLTGRASLGTLEAGGATTILPSGIRLSFDSQCRELLFDRSPEGKGHFAAEQLSLADIQLGVGNLLARMALVTVDAPRLDFGSAGLLLGSSACVVERAAVEIRGVTVDVQRAELPEGIMTSGGSFVVPELLIPDARISVDDLTELIQSFSTEYDDPDTIPMSVPPSLHDLDDRATTEMEAAVPPSPEYAFLDRIAGRLDVDLTMALTIPVIGKRMATHHFRVPINDGIINYRNLEEDLADLENAFISVEVRGKRLVIERKIPLIGLERPLIIWDLDDDELELAKRRLVRLRTVPKLRMAARDSKAVVKVRKLDFDHIDIALELAPPEEGNKDATGHTSVGQVKISGRVTHHSGRADTEAPESVPPKEATSIALSAERIVMGPFKIPMGDKHLEIARVEIDEVGQGKMVFDGLLPRSAALVARGIRLFGLRIV